MTQTYMKLKQNDQIWLDLKLHSLTLSTHTEEKSGIKQDVADIWR